MKEEHTDDRTRVVLFLHFTPQECSFCLVRSLFHFLFALSDYFQTRLSSRISAAARSPPNALCYLSSHYLSLGLSSLYLSSLYLFLDPSFPLSIFPIGLSSLYVSLGLSSLYPSFLDPSLSLSLGISTLYLSLSLSISPLVSHLSP